MKSKNLFKKLSVLALVFIMIFALAACSNDTATEDDDTPSVTEYAVNFEVVDDEDAALAGADVTLDGTTKTTDGNGVVDFSKVDGTYSYTVTADDFENATGDVTVDGADVSVEVPMEAVPAGTPPEAPAVTVASESEFMDALADKVEGITLSADITFDNRVVVTYNLEYLDLGGNTITLNDDNPLVFSGNGTVVSNGNIDGDQTIFMGNNYLADEEWPFQGAIEFSNSVLIDGRDVTFDGVDFDTKVFDWWQDQEDHPASGLTFTDSVFKSYAIFVSDVTIEDSTAYYRLGVDNDDAVLNEVSFEKHPANGTDLVTSLDKYGILYVAGDAELNDLTWADNFTGMYVGKSLKWNLIPDMYIEFPDKAYRRAEPTLTNADVLTDKDGMVWWGVNYDKATLTVNGTVNVESEQGRNGLTLVGTDYRDYEGGNNYDGGRIYGNATFVGADVHFGWQTGDYLYDINTDYNYWEDVYGDVYGYGLFTLVNDGVKYPAIPEAVDIQASMKNADRLTIHGPTFNTEVQIFTPANEYLEGEEIGDNGSMNYPPLNDAVWLGDVEFNNKVNLWGDFAVVDNKTVVNNDEILVRCGNVRRIYAETTGTIAWATDDDPICNHSYPFEKLGTLTGGIISSDTKDQNVLVLGDNLLVENLELNKWLYNVILETTKLSEVEINVGDRNSLTERYVDDGTIDLDLDDADVHVWPHNTAYFENVSWSPATTVNVFDGSGLEFAGQIGNNGDVIFESKTSVFFDNATFAGEDIREGHSVDITNPSETRVYVNAAYAPKSTWHFVSGWDSDDEWKLDYMITADHGIESTFYEVVIGEDVWYLDLRDLDAAGVAGIQDDGMLLSTLLQSDAVVEGPAYDDDVIRDRFGSYFDPDSFEMRMTNVYPDGYHQDTPTDNTKNFNLEVVAWAFNCCDTPVIPLAQDAKDVTLEMKVIDGIPTTP